MKKGLRKIIIEALSKEYKEDEPYKLNYFKVLIRGKDEWWPVMATMRETDWVTFVDNWHDAGNKIVAITQEEYRKMQSSRLVNESITKNQIVIISDEERKRIFEKNAQSIATIQMTEFFLNILDGCEIVLDERWPDSTFYRKNGEVLFEKDVKRKYFYVHYSKIWRVFEGQFGLQYADIQAFIKKVLETLKNFEGLTPEYSPFQKQRRLDDTQNLVGLTPQRSEWEPVEVRWMTLQI